MSSRSYTDSVLYADIAVEGSGRSRAFVLHNKSQATCHLFYHLHKGQRVWPRNAGGSSHDLYGSIYTHFTGFLVQADP